MKTLYVFMLISLYLQVNFSVVDGSLGWFEGIAHLLPLNGGEPDGKNFGDPAHGIFLHRVRHDFFIYKPEICINKQEIAGNHRYYK